MRLSVVGLGKLGSPLAAVLASKGHRVIGVDVNPDYVASLAVGRAPVEEPQLQETIDRGRGNLFATTDFGVAVAESDLTFIIVPTPSDGRGVFSNRFVTAALEAMGPGLRAKDGRHTVVITSTVMPGSCDGEVRDVLERASGRTVGRDLGLCYSPEFIALGSVVRNLLYPDMVLVGESDPDAGQALEAVYRSVCENDPPVRRMTLVNAEITKISVNTYVTTKISYANMLGELCEHLPGADIDVVTAAIGLDTRIGGKYLRGATGYGGPCFPRDNVALAALARGLGVAPLIAEATDRINRSLVGRLMAKVRARLAVPGSVAVLGLSYKPDTAVIEESQGLALTACLLDAGYRVAAWDPLALDAARAALGHDLGGAASLEEAVRSAGLVVVTTPWPEFATLAPDWLRRGDGPRVGVLDCWRVLPAALAGVAEIIRFGRGPGL